MIYCAIACKEVDDVAWQLQCSDSGHLVLTVANPGLVGSQKLNVRPHRLPLRQWYLIAAPQMNLDLQGYAFWKGRQHKWASYQTYSQ